MSRPTLSVSSPLGFIFTIRSIVKLYLLNGNEVSDVLLLPVISGKEEGRDLCGCVEKCV